MSSTFTVFYDGQFWVGVFESSDHGEVHAARHIFGAEPSGPELYQFGLMGFGALLDAAAASPAVIGSKRDARPNPKRTARLLARQRAAPAVSTAAQDARRLAVEANAKARKQRSRAAHQDEADARLEQKRARARARHRGKA